MVGFEPTIFRVTGGCFTRLSYKHHINTAYPQ